VPESQPAFVPPRQPLVPLALAFGIGVAAAAWFPFSENASIPLALSTATACAILLFARKSPSTQMLFVAAALAGAVRYEFSESSRNDSLQLRPTEERRLVRLRGIVARPPISDPVDSPSPLRPTHQPSSRVRLSVERRFVSPDGWEPATGLVDCSVPEAKSPLKRGDRVEAFGWLRKPSPPMNDGESDYADRLRRQGVVGHLTCETATSVLLLDEGSPWTPLRMRDRLLEASRERLQRWMPLKEAGFAEAALLGARTSIRREDMEPWVNSGTLHMLVVSGWHVAVVAAAAWWFSRFVFRSRRRRAVAALLAIWAYTVLTGSEAPAVRAAVFTSMFLFGVMLGRPMQPINALAAGVLVLLFADPQQLFHTGAQLSVLAVAGLLLFPPKLVAPLPSVDPDLGEPFGWRTRWKHRLILAFVSSACACATTAPLVAYHFHLFSPASIWLSVILAPVLVAAIGFSVAVLILADFAIASPFAWGAEWCVRFLNLVVANSEWFPGGFYFCSGPPFWWAVGVMLALWIPFVVRPYWTPKTPHAVVVVLWSLFGAVCWTSPSKPGSTSFHQLSVGHGNAGVLQTADGRTFLFDCGSMTIPGVGERIIAPFLWRRRIQTIDAVFVSHADVDHFNGLPALLPRFKVGAVFAPPQFARLEQPAVQVAAAALKKHGIPLTFVWAGDRMKCDDVDLEALWPTPTARGASDNSNSLVTYARSHGRSVFSTGDLAEQGLRTVMRMVPPTIDAFVIPHHGGKSCNPPELAEWASPRIAIGSQHGKSGDTISVYRDVGAFTARTDLDGAVSIQWEGDDLVATTFRTKRQIRLCK
jgi:competence protein ComEC